MNFLSGYERFPLGKANAVADADKKSDHQQCGESARGREKHEPEPAVGRENIMPGKLDHRDKREPQRRDHKSIKPQSRAGALPATNRGDRERVCDRP